MTGDQISPAVWRKLQRSSFVHFLAKAWPHVDAGKQLAMNWHLFALALSLEDEGLYEQTTPPEPQPGI